MAFSNATYAIDEDMKKHIAINSEIIVECCTTVGKKEGITQLEADKFLKVSKELFSHNAWTVVQEEPLVLKRIIDITPEEQKTSPKFKR